MKILVGLSGGVDSAVAAYLLKEQGHELVAGFMKNYTSDEGNCTTYNDAVDAIKVAEFLGIEIRSYDLQKEYQERIIDYIFEGYQRGITPNPDVLCNSLIKFDVFLQKALEEGFDAVAMGHYARVEKDKMDSVGKLEGGYTRFLPYNPNLKEKARVLRENMTKTEQRLRFEYLKNLKYKVLRQHPIDNYIVDFYIASKRLVLEIDGETHRTDKELAYDTKRTSMLESYGLKVVRFTNSDVFENLEGVIQQIEEYLSSPLDKKGNLVGKSSLTKGGAERSEAEGYGEDLLNIPPTPLDKGGHSLENSSLNKGGHSLENSSLNKREHSVEKSSLSKGGAERSEAEGYGEDTLLNIPPTPLDKGGHSVENSSLDKQGGFIYYLLRGVDHHKDQSYFLAGLNQFQLQHSVFPLGNLTKPEVRELAKKIGLPNAERRDSQGLCFIGNVPIKTFLMQKFPIKKGEIRTLEDKLVGTHDGAYFFTIGQKQGLGLNFKAYVYRIDIEKNIVYVCDKDAEELQTQEMKVKDRHWIAEEWELGIPFAGKIRYRQPEPVPCTIIKKEKTELTIRFDQPQRAVAPGQVFVAYDGERCLGCGIIG